MSSHQITVAQLIEKLRQFPPSMLVAVPSPCHADELYEGILDGPRHFDVVEVTDVRTGFNPVCHDWPDGDWPVLLIRADDSRAYYPTDGFDVDIKFAVDKEFPGKLRTWKETT